MTDRGARPTGKSRYVHGASMARVALAWVLSVAMAGCAHVPPYRRGRLAHPTMLLGDFAGPGEAHIYAIQEGAVGGGAGAEGGCGCN
jgi:hypothetical protein